MKITIEIDAADKNPNTWPCKHARFLEGGELAFENPDTPALTFSHKLLQIYIRFCPFCGCERNTGGIGR
jgi:hypothetical protein